MSKEATARSAISAERAMKLALEALEYIEHNYMSLPAPAEKAVTALREALAEQPVVKQDLTPEQPAQQDSTCNKTLREQGKTYPRTCKKCGLGPCIADRVQPAQQQEPVALKWQQAPIRTAWGDDMVVASVAIDKDHTVCLYCERDQTPKVDAMFAQRTWVHATEWRGLTDEEIDEWTPEIHTVIRAIEAKLKERNT